MLQFANLAVIFEDEYVILLGDDLDGSLHLVSLFGVGVDDFQEISQCSQVLLIDIIKLLQKFFLLGGEGGPNNVELSSHCVSFTQVAVVSFFDESQETFLELVHAGL